MVLDTDGSKVTQSTMVGLQAVYVAESIKGSEKSSIYVCKHFHI